MASPFEPGARVERYLILRRLAVGGMAELFLARVVGVEGLDKLVVIKTLLPAYAADPHFARMLLDEARIASTLQHPNIIPVFDSGEAQGQPFLAMEYVDGRDLGQILDRAHERGEEVPLEVAIAIIIGVAAGLHHAHEQLDPDGRAQGIIHRDVSPANALVGRDGTVKLIDFGVAKAFGQRAATRGGMIKGKIAFMSPEQCRGGPLDRRSDVFSLGLVLYQLTVGRHPFAEATEYTLLRKIVEEDVVPPSTVRPEYPPALASIVLRALARERDDRYHTAEELQIDLETFARDSRLSMSPVERGRYVTSLFPAEAPQDDSGTSTVARIAPSGSSLVERKAATTVRRRLRTGLAALAIASVLTIAVVAVRQGHGPALDRNCGNGLVDLGEECDDGNARNDDGCTSRCLSCRGDDRHAGRTNGHCYQRHDSPLPWQEARASCWAGGGHLVTYSDTYEAEQVGKALLLARPDPRWIAAFEGGGQGARWDDGEALPAMNVRFEWLGSAPDPTKNECLIQHPGVISGKQQQSGRLLVGEAAPCSRPAGYVCEREGWTRRKSDGHAYLRVVRPVGWKEAGAVCQTMAAHLVTVASAEEESFLETTFHGASWLGASDNGDRKSFHWLNGEPFLFQDFSANEPDQPGEEAACVVLDVDGTWHDRTCTQASPSLCEKD